ncbi:MAG: pilus assembly protein [Amylibacter sp.]
MAPFKRLIQRLCKKEDGSIFVEAIIAIPVVSILTIGILEYGNVLWQRHQIQTGVRDAARYMSRCRDTFMPCDMTIARNIAFYGKPVVNKSTDFLRVKGWYGDSGLQITTPFPPAGTTPSDVVIINGISTYNASPLFNLLQIDPITIQYQYEMRYIGW